MGYGQKHNQKQRKYERSVNHNVHYIRQNEHFNSLIFYFYRAFYDSNRIKASMTYIILILEFL